MPLVEGRYDMTCTYCGTTLPTGALFCGECGRAVVGSPSVSVKLATAPPPSVEDRQDLDHPAAVSTPVENPVPPLVIPRSDGAATIVCEQCGSPMSEDDIFCGACGFVSKAASEDFGRSRDTAIIELAPGPTPVARPLPVPVVDRLPDFDHAALDSSAQPNPLRPPPEPPRVGVSESSDTRSSDAKPIVSFDDTADLEATRISRLGRAGERFVLQFSTGESFTVYGSGLIGRNPRSEPGEYFDQLVRVLDPSRSVSKVHLEFGQDSGRFWIMDRFSGNGTTVREPETEPVRCQPEKRLRLTRGTRVDIGEQFFIVS
jgi:hypothetical protein